MYNRENRTNGPNHTMTSEGVTFPNDAVIFSKDLSDTETDVAISTGFSALILNVTEPQERRQTLHSRLAPFETVQTTTFLFKLGNHYSRTASGARLLIYRGLDNNLLSTDNERTVPTLACVLNNDWLALFSGGKKEKFDGGEAGEKSGDKSWGFFLSESLRSICYSVFEDKAACGPLQIYRALKCQELVWETFAALQRKALVPVNVEGDFSPEEFHRLNEARQIIATRYREKLTLDTLGRACGLNRTKLSAGFRALFNRTVGDTIVEERLTWAARQLRTTDETVTDIAYDSGYLNNASFARAFSNRFGMPPSRFRRHCN